MLTEKKDNKTYGLLFQNFIISAIFTDGFLCMTQAKYCMTKMGFKPANHSMHLRYHLPVLVDFFLPLEVQMMQSSLETKQTKLRVNQRDFIVNLCDSSGN
jgi:hypothetical protein